MSEVTIVLAVLLIITIVIGGGLIIWLIEQRRKLQLQIVLLDDKNIRILSQKKSSEVRLGQISEQLVPFLSVFKYDPKKAHFIGQPIDYVVFEDDAVIFIEVKSGGAQLTNTQKAIKQLVKDGKVRWEEIRVNGEAGKEEKDVGVSSVSESSTLRETSEVPSQTQTNIQLPHVPAAVSTGNMEERV